MSPRLTGSIQNRRPIIALHLKLNAMKRNFFKSGVLALLIGLSGAAFGNPTVNDKEKARVETEKSGSLEVKIYPRDNGFVSVNFRKNENETVEVKIYTRGGEMIFDEKIKSSELVARKYNLQSLPDGYYYFEVSNGNYLVRQLVNKEN